MSDSTTSEWRERVGVRLMHAMECHHSGEHFGAGAVCQTCWQNAQRIGAILESEVREWSTHALATGYRAGAERVIDEYPPAYYDHESRTWRDQATDEPVPTEPAGDLLAPEGEAV